MTLSDGVLAGCLLVIVGCGLVLWHQGRDGAGVIVVLAAIILVWLWTEVR